MQIEFSKMHGLGNDFIFIDTRNTLISFSDDDLEKLSVRLCNRNYGIGADGMVVIAESGAHDARFIIYNSDGSRARMCGNAIRCLAWLVYERDSDKKTELEVETDSGIVYPCLVPDMEGRNHMIRVNMGKPEFSPEKIPCHFSKPVVRDEIIETGSGRFRISAVSMGNPHAVIFMDVPEKTSIAEIGRDIENHHLFPRRTNVEFIKKLSDTEIIMRVWERGAGETLACGTGACAAAVVCIDSKITGNRVTVHLEGGDLEVEWDGKDGNVYMTGPAVHVFDGVIEI